MSSGQCLCGSVAWEIEGAPVHAYHCHCSMCRKAHGAAFGTYYYMGPGAFHWRGGLDTIRRYRSSPGLTRAFCGACGSVTPSEEDGGGAIFVPAGSHDDGPAVGAHIFVASRAPWVEIADGLPQYEAYPPEVDLPAYPTPQAPAGPEGAVRGSCLCGAVSFHVTAPFRVVHNCFCGRCRRARAAAFATNGFTAMDGVRFVSGQDRLSSFKLPAARFFTQVFCSACGSGMPRIDPGREIAIVPLGALDDDPGRRADDNIFVGHRARWYEIGDGLPAFDGAPPG